MVTITGTDWRKSSYSTYNGACIEVASSAAQAQWVKSSLSFSNGNCAEVAAWRKATRRQTGECAEVGQGAAVVAVRDSKDRGKGPVLVFPADSWREFTGRVKDRGSV